MLKAARFFGILAATIIWIFPISSFAQIGSMPETLFGAQSLALGRSALITPYDALAMSWNPAGVTALQRVTASVAFGSLPANDDSHTSMGFVIPTRRLGYFGVSFFQTRISFTRRGDTGQELGNANDTQRQLLFTYGKNFSAAFAIGINVKFIGWDLGGEAATVENPGVDFGVTYRLQESSSLLKNLAFGIAIDNFIKPATKFYQIRESRPAEIRLMAEKTFILGENKLTLVGNEGFLESNFSQMKNRFVAGIEYFHRSTVALRFGWYGENFSIGTGLQFKGVRLDYARNHWQRASESLSSTTDIVTLTYQF